MAAVGTKSQTLALLASVLVSGCSFFPEQSLLPSELVRDENVAGANAAPRGAMTSAVSSAGRGADSAAPRATASGSMTQSSQAAAAGSGMTSRPLDAGMSTAMASAGSNATPAAGSGGSGPAAGSGASGPAAGSGADGMSGEDQPKRAQDPTCDLSGVWITKQLSASKALEEVGYSHSYAYYEIEQSGSDFVVKKHIDCGGIALGGGTGSLPRATLEALTQRNSQSGRKGRFELVDGKCTVDIDHFWSVRGANEERFLPPTRDSTMTMADLMKQKPMPTASMQDGAEDWDNDGHPAITTTVTGIISGDRYGCQRDWDRWFTAPGFEITPSLDFTTDFTIRFEFEGEEALLYPTVGLLATPAEVDYSFAPTMRFRFLGRTMDDPRAQAIVKADPVETCYAIQDAIPAEEPPIR
jgi:hypothetical protein